MSNHSNINSFLFGNNSSVANTQGYWAAIKDAYSISSDGLGGAGWSGFSLDETEKVAPEVLPPPSNIMVSTPLLTNRAYDIRWDPSPSLFVLGYGVYRAYRQLGEYVRLTDTTIQTNTFRDQNQDVFVDSEKVPFKEETGRGGWRIDSTGQYVIVPEKCPIVSAGGFGKYSNDPNDVIVEIDGVRVQPVAMHGERGEIILNSRAYYDPLKNEFVEALLPQESSDVRVSYWYQKNFLSREATRHYPPYYKVTSVAFDMERGVLIETNPDLIPSTTLHMEQIDWIWEEAIRRNAWIAEMAGERVLAFQQKKSGVVCGCVYRDIGTFYPAQDCKDCLGTGFIGGYDGPYPLIVVIPFAEKGFSLQDRGHRRTDSFDSMWAPPYPLLEQYDVISRQDGTLHMVGPVTRPNHRGFMALQQRFSTEFIQFHAPQYQLLRDLDDNIRPLSYADGRVTQIGNNDNTVHLISDKSPEPVIHFKGNTFRYATIAY